MVAELQNKTVFKNISSKFGVQCQLVIAANYKTQYKYAVLLHSWVSSALACNRKSIWPQNLQQLLLTECISLYSSFFTAIPFPV